MHDCKICNKSFLLVSSLAAHYSSAHSERPKKKRIMLTKTCKCGKQFTVECKIGREHKTNKCCSRKCANSKKIDNLKKKIVNCYMCNKPVHVGLRSSKIKCNDCKEKRQQIIKIKRIAIRQERRKHNKKNKKEKLYQYFNFICEHCNEPFKTIHKNRRFCGRKCSSRHAGHFGGLKSSQSKINRSKNEINFYELCYSKFDNVLHNKPLFNGWDADIILLDLKIAILWNGPWHYRKCNKKHSVLQVQTRDKIKVDQIRKCGFKEYVIKDDGKENKEFVLLKFKQFIQSMSLWHRGCAPEKRIWHLKKDNRHFLFVDLLTSA
jgi:hypothetical protein